MKAGRRVLLLAALLGALPAALAAQGEVGNEPERSPYRDIFTHQGFTLFAGRFAGNTGPAHTGPRPGLAIGARLQVRISGAVDIWASFGEAMSSRERLDVSGDTTKDMGSIKARLLMFDLAMALNLTGDKTWHGFAPYVGVGAGIVAPNHKVIDPGGFELGSNFTLVPTIGTRLFIARSLALRFEIRDYYYRYTFPLDYYQAPGHQGVIPATEASRQWYNNLTLWAGVTYGFDF